jgi:hypothetical protein
MVALVETRRSMLNGVLQRTSRRVQRLAGWALLRAVLDARL